MSGRRAADVDSQHNLQTEDEENHTAGDFEAFQFDSQQVKDEVVEEQEGEHENAGDRCRDECLSDDFRFA